MISVFNSGLLNVKIRVWLSLIPKERVSCVSTRADWLPAMLPAPLTSRSAKAIVMRAAPIVATNQSPRTMSAWSQQSAPSFERAISTREEGRALAIIVNTCLRLPIALATGRRRHVPSWQSPFANFEQTKLYDPNRNGSVRFERSALPGQADRPQSYKAITMLWPIAIRVLIPTVSYRNSRLSSCSFT